MKTEERIEIENPTRNIIGVKFLNKSMSPVNLKTNKESYRFNSNRDIRKNHLEVMEVIKEYLERHCPADDDQLYKIYKDLEKYENFVCHFDDYSEVSRFGEKGKRVAYGAFRFGAYVHDVQDKWTYTFEIIDTDEEYFMVLDSYNWTKETNIREKVNRIVA